MFNLVDSLCHMFAIFEMHRERKKVWSLQEAGFLTGGHFCMSGKQEADMGMVLVSPSQAVGPWADGASTTAWPREAALRTVWLVGRLGCRVEAAAPAQAGRWFQVPPG